MINYLSISNLEAYRKRQADRRAWEAAEFKRQMDTFVSEQEKRYTEIRKYEYMRVRNEVKRGLRSSIDLLEFEIYKGWL